MRLSASNAYCSLIFTNGMIPSPCMAYLRTLLRLFMFLWASTSFAQNPFITTWKTDNPGTSNSTSITVPTFTGDVYNYDVDWNNDGTYDEFGLTGDVTHNFGVAGTYTIRIQGAFPRIYFNNVGDRQKLLDVGQWGDIAWTSMENAFYGCHSLDISATDLPNLSGVTSMSVMFADCFSLNSPANIGDWNTASVTNMSRMFSRAATFNQPIGDWNTAAVTNMRGMFEQADAFDQPIGPWNTASVTDMNNMFSNADVFNQPLGAWNTASVTTTQNMFLNVSVFNQPLGAWNTASVTNMIGMFTGCSAFNQPIGTWNTASVTTMQAMFLNASVFNQPLGTWNTASVTNMRNMFNNATAFNQPIGTWNTASVTNMLTMFSGSSAFNQPIGTWNTASVTIMTGMFQNATAFNQPIGTWTLNNAVTLTSMLDNCGMDCDNYSATLIGWSGNPVTPNNRSLGATGRQYGTNAVAARTNLDITKAWTISGDAPSGQDCPLVLPVELLHFHGKATETGVLLEWATASERRNEGFHVERSTDGIRFEEIGFVPGNGTTSEAHDYSFLDETVGKSPLESGSASPENSGGVFYYRLRQMDFDGGEEFSKVVAIDLSGLQAVLHIFPNPTSTTATLEWNSEYVGEARLSLYNFLGNQVKTINLSPDGGVLRTIIDLDGLAAGAYLVEVVAGGRSWRQRFVIK